MPGPPPKRTEHRRRANKDVVEVDKGTAKPTTAPRVPSGLHPLARKWFQSLRDSGQSDYYQASDWAAAAVAAELLSRQLKSDAPSAAMVQVWSAMATSLLTTEGDRRRLRLELERAPAAGADKGGANVSWIDEFRRTHQSG